MKATRLATLGLLMLGLLLTPILVSAEDSFIVGSYVQLDNGEEIWVSQYGEGEKSIVFFAGFGASCATYEFIPMIKEINEKLPEYTVYVYDYPGTGKSGAVDAERTVQNITAEIHETMQKLGIEHFTPIIHSISGAYLLYYVNQYPGEVDRLICIDNSVPKQALVTPYDEMYAYYDEAVETYASEDWDAVTPEKDPQYFYLPDNYTFTDAELTRYIDYVRNTYNETTIAELHSMEPNLTGMLEMKFPDDLPVLMLVSTGTQEEMPDWHALHEEMITSENHEMRIIEGSHYLHYDARDEIMPIILEYLSK